MKNAFTLVELLVALAITSVLATLLLGIVSATMNVWQQGRNQIDTFASARQVLSRMADEAKGAIARATPAAEFSENVASLAGSTTPVAKTAENIFFVAPYPNSGSGDLCVIAYRLNSDTHELQRAFLDSQTAWAGSPRYKSSGYNSLTWRTIAQGVLEFEVRSFSQNDLDEGNDDPNDTWNSIGSNSAMVGNVPRRILFRMKVLDEKSLARLNAATSNVNIYNRIVAQSAREFTTGVTMIAPSPSPTPAP